MRAFFSTPMPLAYSAGSGYVLTCVARIRLRSCGYVLTCVARIRLRRGAMASPYAPHDTYPCTIVNNIDNRC